MLFNNKNEFDTSKIAEGWTIENIKGKKYGEEKLPQWMMNENITKINFLNKIVPEYINYWFYDLMNLTTIENMSNLDTSNITDMSEMFSGCDSLQNVDLTGLDTSNVTDMNSMFAGCNSLQSIEITGLDTSNVTAMNGLFYNCKALTVLDLSELDTRKVETAPNMFFNVEADIYIGAKWNSNITPQSTGYKKEFITKTTTISET